MGGQVKLQTGRLTNRQFNTSGQLFAVKKNRTDDNAHQQKETDMMAVISSCASLRMEIYLEDFLYSQR